MSSTHLFCHFGIFNSRKQKDIMSVHNINEFTLKSTYHVLPFFPWKNRVSPFLICKPYLCTYFSPVTIIYFLSYGANDIGFRVKCVTMFQHLLRIAIVKDLNCLDYNVASTTCITTSYTRSVYLPLPAVPCTDDSLTWIVSEFRVNLIKNNLSLRVHYWKLKKSIPLILLPWNL